MANPRLESADALLNLIAELEVRPHVRNALIAVARQHLQLILAPVAAEPEPMPVKESIQFPVPEPLNG